MDVLEKILSIVFSVLILFNGIYYRLKIGTWMNPASLFSLFWFLYTFIPLVCLFYVYANFLAVFYILLCVLVFSISANFYHWSRKPMISSSTIIQFDTTLLRITFLVSLIIAISGNIYQVLNQDISIEQIFTDIILVGSEIASKRYAEEIEVSAFGQLGIFSSYISIIIGGLMYGNTESKGLKKVTFLAFLPFLIILLTQSQKGLIILGFFLFLGGIMVNKLMKRDFVVFTSGFLKRMSIIFVTSILLMGVSFLSRGGANSDYVEFAKEKLLDKFASYSMGHLYAFSAWFTQYMGGISNFKFDVSTGHLGKYTFMFLWKLGGYKHEVLGVYDEYFVFGNTYKSNIYTIFRGLIMDFGSIGALVLFFLIGFIFNNLFYTFIEIKTSVMLTLSLIFLVGFIYMSWIISILIWSNIPVVFFVLYIILVVNNKVKLKF